MSVSTCLFLIWLNYTATQFWLNYTIVNVAIILQVEVNRMHVINSVVSRKEDEASLRPNAPLATAGNRRGGGGKGNAAVSASAAKTHSRQLAICEVRLPFLQTYAIFIDPNFSELISPN